MREGQAGAGAGTVRRGRSCLDLTRQIERSLASEKLSCRGACMNTKPISTEDYCTVCWNSAIQSCKFTYREISSFLWSMAAEILVSNRQQQRLGSEMFWKAENETTSGHLSDSICRPCISCHKKAIQITHNNKKRFEELRWGL